MERHPLLLQELMKSGHTLALLCLVGCTAEQYQGLTEEPGDCVDLAEARGEWVVSEREREPYRSKVGRAADADEIFFMGEGRIQVAAFNPMTLAERETTPAPDEFYLSDLASNDDDYLLLVGGASSKEPYVPSPYARVWSWSEQTWSYYPFPEYLAAEGDYRPYWHDGEFIFWGGTRGGGSEPIADGAAFDPSDGTWRPLGTGERPSLDGDTVVTDEGLFLWTYQEKSKVPEPWAYTSATDSWRRVSVEGGPSPRHTYLTSTGDKIYLTGGYVDNKEGWFRDLWELTLETETWRQIPVPEDAGLGGPTKWVGDQLIWLPDQYCRGSYTYRPATGEWGATPALHYERVAGSQAFVVGERLTTVGLIAGHGFNLDFEVRQLVIDEE